MSEDRLPILVGAAQFTQKGVDPAEALEPLAMMEKTARDAAEDAGLGARLFAAVDTVGVVNIFSYDYGNSPRLLAERLGARPRSEVYTSVGGNSPLLLLNEVARRIAAGRIEVALLSGAEALASTARARKHGTTLGWTAPYAGEAPERLGYDLAGNSDHEIAHGLHAPIEVYPLFENALRARAGREPAAHQRRLGELYARFSAIAAENPYAWFPSARSAEEIATVRPDNRMIGYPYPKLMNAIMKIDQSASLIVTSVAAARRLGIAEERWVYVAGVGDAHDHWFVSDRVDYASSPAIRAAGAAALEMAGMTIDEASWIDLYSCFPSAVQIGRAALDIADDDPRPLTVTGGLAHAGGPASNYPMHSVATLVGKLRGDRTASAVATGLGWYLTKHSVTVLRGRRSEHAWNPRDTAEIQAEVDTLPGPPFTTTPGGAATIETFTVLHDRDGAPSRGIVFGRQSDGRRFLANTPADRATLESLMRGEAVGRSGRVEAGAKNRFDPA